jgi:hypothetical protein
MRNMQTPYIVKYLNVRHRKNENGKSVVQYYLCTKEELAPNQTITRHTKRIPKSEALASNLPIIEEALELLLF